MTTSLVVGAGPSGLGTALTLASQTDHDVILIDRIPVVGGEPGWDNAEIRRVAQDVGRAGVRLRLGATATRWTGDRLHITAPGSVEQLRAAHLFFAGGRRPATAADLLMDGERPAGIIPATVAEHLLTTGVALWKRPLIVGNAAWAPRLAHHIRDYGGYVLGLKDSSSWATESIDASGPMKVLGRERVTGLRIYSSPEAVDIWCDAIILAGGPFPNRNIVGALEEGADRVTFVQPIGGDAIEERIEAARAITADWIRSTGGKP